jgi:hypothetical protein
MRSETAKACDGPLGALTAFREGLYDCLDGWADAAFELGDAVLCGPGPVTSLPGLSLEPACRRGHGSGHKALRGCRVDAEAARDLLAANLPAGPPVFAVDASAWPRPEADTSPGRGYYYTTAKGSSGQPVVPGWRHQAVAALDWEADSWSSPADVARIEPGQNASGATAAQVKALTGRLGGTRGSPLLVFDAGYNAAALAWELAGVDATIVVRVRDDRVFYEEAPPKTPGRNGRPRRHGPKRRCSEPGDWPAPDRELAESDSRYGFVRVQAWQGLHPQLARRGHWQGHAQAPIVAATIVKLEVERLPGPKGKPKQALWLWVSGTEADLRLIWRAYIHRFDIEHCFRFWKQTLGWTTPKIATPDQADTWTWLLAGAYTQLRLARPLAADHRLPWEPKTTKRLTPNRVRRGFRRLAQHLGTPAKPPKPSKPGPGRPKGSTTGPRQRHPVIKTTPTKV